MINILGQLSTISMTSSFNYKDSFDTAATANKSIGFDTSAINFVFAVYSSEFKNSSIAVPIPRTDINI